MDANEFKSKLKKGKFIVDYNGKEYFVKDYFMHHDEESGRKTMVTSLNGVIRVPIYGLKYVRMKK